MSTNLADRHLTYIRVKCVGSEWSRYDVHAEDGAPLGTVSRVTYSTWWAEDGTRRHVAGTRWAAAIELWPDPLLGPLTDWEQEHARVVAERVVDQHGPAVARSRFGVYL
jgi:hypothetical protein